MAAVHPLDWIQEIEASLLELDEKPQFGLPAPFNWEHFEKELQQLLSRSDLKITHTAKGWMSADQIFAGMGGSLESLVIECSPLYSPAFFVTDQQNLKDMMSILFESDSAANFFYDAGYVQSFNNYFAAEILHLIEKQQFASPLALRLGSLTQEIQELIGEHSCFVVDLCLSLGGKNFWGRLLLTESFRRDWKNYFAHLKPAALSEELKAKLKVEIGLEVAYCRLSFEEWKKVKNGDFIILDRCSYDPAKAKGGVVLTIHGKPIFRGRFKDGAIKLTNYPVYEEESDAMEEEPFDKDIEHEEEEEDLYGDLSEESEFEEEEEDLLAGLEPRKKPEKEERKPVKITAAEEISPVAPLELPVHLTVEVGRLQMTAGELMNLAPGNLLELNVTPQQGVTLVVNGKKVGRGEIIKIGDVLGVRILSI